MHTLSEHHRAWAAETEAQLFSTQHHSVALTSGQILKKLSPLVANRLTIEPLIVLVLLRRP
eukprot:1151243-Pelagomonas_calceolata.AAC.3